jgi:hypothetical protein
MYQALVYPVTDLLNESQSRKDLAEGYIMDRNMAELFTNCYLRSEEE